MDDYYNTEQLKARGWTAFMIKTHLGKPDEQTSDPSGRLRKLIKFYRIDRVHTLEASTAKSDLEKQSEVKALARRALEFKKKKISN